MYYISYFLRSILARIQKIGQCRIFLQDSRFLQRLS